MDSRILLYNLPTDSEKGASLHKLASALGITVRMIDASELGKTAGYLAGIEDCGRGGAFDGQSPDCEFMLMCGLGEQTLDKLLAGMRDAGIRIRYKAILTETNRDWRLFALIAEIKREYAVVSALISLRKAAAVAEGFTPGDFTDASAYERLRDLLGRAGEIQRNPEPDTEKIAKLERQILIELANLRNESAKKSDKQPMPE